MAGAISIPQSIDQQLKKSQVEQILRASCTSVHDTLAGGFTVGIKRAGQEFPDSVEYRYLGPAPTVGDDVLVFRVGDGYIVAGIDETVLSRESTQVVVSDTVAETTVYTYTIPANTLTTIRGLSILYILHGIDPASVATMTARLKINGVTEVTAPNATGLSASPGTDYVNEWQLIPMDSLNSQIIIPAGGSAGAPSPVAMDATIDNVLTLTVQMSIADPSVVTTLKYVRLERK